MPFDPNGMVMDFLRSCYRQRIMFVAGQPGTGAVATWYFAAPTARPLPFPHAFGSPTWDIVHPTPTTIGFDATTPPKYYNGRSLNSSRGDRFAGPATYFVNGAPAPANLQRALNGTPLECLTPPLGLSLSGRSVDVTGSYADILLSAGSFTPPPPVTPCFECSGVTPATVTVTLSGLTTGFLNGTFVLPQYTTPCIWQMPVSTGEIRISKFFGDWILLADDGVGGSAIYKDTSPGACTGSFTLNQIATNIGGDPTASAVA